MRSAGSHASAGIIEDRIQHEKAHTIDISVDSCMQCCLLGQTSDDSPQHGHSPAVTSQRLVWNNTITEKDYKHYDNFIKTFMSNVITATENTKSHSQAEKTTCTWALHNPWKDQTWTTELNSLQGGLVKDLLKSEVQKGNGKHAEAT